MTLLAVNGLLPVILGAGLGLFIVKGIVEAHRGRITVASAPDQGSRFDPEGREFILVYGSEEDEESELESEFDVLARRASAEQALEILRQPGQGAFDVVLLDYHMPDMDGLEFLRHVRADDREDVVPLVIVMVDDDRDAGAAVERIAGDRDVEQVGRVLALDPPHVSAYALTIEPATATAIEAHAPKLPRISPERIAEELGFSEETMRVIRVGGLLHDVGKIGVPEGEIEAYINSPSVSVGAANLSIDDIFEEKWKAMFLHPEAWVDARRFDYKYEAFTVPANLNPNLNGQFLKRLAYPGSEVSRNGNNVPDVTLLDPIFWDE